MVALGIGELPQRSIDPHLFAVDYPTTRDELVLTAEEDEAPPEVINLFKGLPREQYNTADEVLRDLAEAARRFGMWPSTKAPGWMDRRNIGHDVIENAPKGKTRHP